MGRFDRESDGDVYDILNWGRFKHNLRVHLKGLKGQKMLAELEAALLTLPEPRLINHILARKYVVNDWLDEKVEVCAIGALALAKGIPFQELEYEGYKRMESRYDQMEVEEQSEYIASKCGMLRILAIELAYINDERQWVLSQRGYKDETPEERYERVLKWVRAKRNE